MRVEEEAMRCQNRAPLGDLAPLAAPWGLFIEPTNVCNFRCRFCPTGHTDMLKESGRKYGFMSMDLYRKIIGDIVHAGWMLKKIHVHKDGEPTLHPNYAAMMRMIRPHTEVLWVRTNGSKLSPTLARDWADAGVDRVCVSIAHPTPEGYKRITGANMDVQKLRTAIADMKALKAYEVYVKVLDTGLTQEETELFYNTFEPVCDFIAIEKMYSWGTTPRDMTMGLGNAYDPSNNVCPYIFYEMAINSDGTVSACCSDWSRSIIVGDVNNESLQDIWNGDKFNDLRMWHLKHGHIRAHDTCKECGFVRISPDNIDNKRFEILGRMR